MAQTVSGVILSMKKRIAFAAIGLLIVIAILGGIKTFQIRAMIDKGKTFTPPPETVTTAAVKSETWDAAMTAVGTLNAVQGLTVAAELPGRAAKIEFEPGTTVKKGDILLRQDTSSEEAQLPGVLGQVNLYVTNLERADQLFAKGLISRADRDIAVANAEQARAQAETIRATIAKKTVRAPFSGRLGIRQVNLGQILREGDPIVTLQALDPMYVDFALPQQQLPQLGQGLLVKVSGDALPGVTLEGRITTINPQVDVETRSIKVQATVSNRMEKLRPGMFVNVSVGLPSRQKVLTIPATAVFYAPYSDSVFVIEDGKDGKSGKTLRQQFVRLGEKRGDFVAVSSGINEGDIIVSTGVFKLRNGMSVVVDNKLAPDFQKSPKPENN